MERVRERGSVYLLVLVSTMIVVGVGLSALLAIRVRHQSVILAADAADAGLYARAGVEIGIDKIGATSSWRTAVPGDGKWIVDQKIGRGTLSLSVSDPADGDVDDSEDDPVLLLGTGVRGSARQLLSVLLTPRFDPVTCLASTIHASGTITISSAALSATGYITSNTTVSATGASVTGDVQAVSAVTGGTYLWTTTTGITARTMPGSSVLSYYLANGTAISRTLLAGGAKRLEKVVLSPASNPFGASNPLGIYVIDLQNTTIEVQNCRIVGTLVLLNVKSDSLVQSSVNWEPAVAGFPALLVTGSPTLSTGAAVLNESAQGVNFNPSDTPYQGVSDADTSDTYPSEIHGLIYVEGNPTLEDVTAIRGQLLVKGNLTVLNSPGVTYSDASYADPPPGFRTYAAMEIVPGTWARIVE